MLNLNLRRPSAREELRELGVGHLEEVVAISAGADPSKSSPPHGARVRKLSRVRVRKGSTIFTPEPAHGDGGGRYASDYLNA